MVGSVAVGVLLVVLGGVCVTAGIVVAVTVVMRGAGAFGVEQITNLLKAIAEVLKALGALPAGTQLVVLGMVLIGGGSYLLTARPF